MRIGIDLRSNRLTFCVRHLLPIVCIAWLAGCNAVVNFDDYQFHPGDDPKAGDGGSGGRGGNGGKGGGGAGGKPSEEKDSGTPDEEKDASTLPDSGPDEKEDAGQDAGPDDKHDSGPGGCQPSTEDCNNDLDDDCDNLRDCKDPDCASNQVCCVPNQIPETSCSGGIDNDCDGDIDCADSDCAASPMCCVASAEYTAGACSDGQDNDCDGLKDCQDTGCVAQPSCCNATGAENTAVACADTTDNDCDGLKNCLDPDCATTSACCTPTAASEVNCNDNVDDDCDNQVDCLDPNCSAASNCTMCVKNPAGALNETSCNDNTDNDCDFYKDCRDADCTSSLLCCLSTGPENTDFACTDGADNDCDGLKDCGSDPDCTGLLACCTSSGTENTPTACNDGIDNDCDGSLDCNDPECNNIGACCSSTTPENNVTACSDAKDNDCDGKLDCVDSDCAGIGSCCAMTSGEIGTLGVGCCVPDGMTEAAAPNDGKDNDCDGLVDRPVLMQAFPTQGMASAAGEVNLRFMSEINANAKLKCWTHRTSETIASWSDCPIPNNDQIIRPFTAVASMKPDNNGVWVTDVRWDFPGDLHSDVFTFRYYVHHTLHGVPHCMQPHTDMQWFMKAGERLIAGASQPVFKQGVDTFLANPFVRVTYEIPASSWPDWQLDGLAHQQSMWSLRRRFTLSPDGKLLLITRNYQSTRSGKCLAGRIKVHDTQMMAGPRDNTRFKEYGCQAFVLNRAGAGVCLIPGATEPAYPMNTDSNEVFSNGLGWPKANKFMWRILTEDRNTGPRNFTKKCDTTPCDKGIYLPDRASFP